MSRRQDSPAESDADDARLLPRYRRRCEHLEHGRILDEILLETGASVDEVVPASSQHTAADARSLRGIPVVGRGIGGAVRGSDPLAELLRREGRQGRRSGR